jgi:nucleoside-diphosphate-sugar epimerase
MGLTQGEQIWSYLHAYDLATAFQAVIQCSSITGIVNVGNPQTIQISQIAKLVGGILGREYLIDFGAIPYRKDQVMSLWPKCEKLTQIGWSPKVDILDGLKNTISWLQKRESLRLKLIDQTELDFKIPIRR